MTDSPYNRFQKSREINYEKWHDGIGFDLEAFDQLSPQDKKSVVASLASGTLTWREIEVFERDNSAAARRALINAAQDPNPETRVCALRSLHHLGLLKDYPKYLAKELAHVDIGKGLTQLLDQLPDYDTPEIRAALLKNIPQRPEVAVHYAALLYFLAGKAKSSFDWDHRPFFLKFGPHADPRERQAAYETLCQALHLSTPAKRPPKSRETP